MTRTAGVPSCPASRPIVRVWWAAVGFVAVGFGLLGLVVPGLPATGFFIAAAWCFSRSSRRLEAWLLGLPAVGRMVGDYRDGLGMRRGAKAVAVASMWTAIALSTVALRNRPLAGLGVVLLGAVGTVVVVWRVPTQERVLAARAAASRS